MASIIVFSTLRGVFFKEWSGVSWWTKGLVMLGIELLVAATAVIGLGNQTVGGSGRFRNCCDPFRWKVVKWC